MNPKRKTTGIRVPNHTICQALLENLGNPIVSTSAHLPPEPAKNLPIEKAELFDALKKQVDLIIDDDSDPGFAVSTIIDLTADEPVIARKGLGWDVLSEYNLSVN